jgi:t-SNARE complex subunit (syntaxin)
VEYRHEDPGVDHSAQSVLERESMQLQLLASNDLDAVQHVERQMVDITTLLSQFAALVGDQSLEVADIYAATESAKRNVESGQENLVQAKERTESSRHYVATLIAALSVLLLLFHWVRP